MSKYGDIAKRYEEQTTSQKLIPGLPVYARMDGKSFSNFTKKFKTPYDKDFREVMGRVTVSLMKETGAIIGYHQSDEISLVWDVEYNSKSQFLFDGSVFKLVGELSSLTTILFYKEALNIWPEYVENKMPRFDARVINLPNRQAVIDTLHWREDDATKNSINMAARKYYAHSQLHKKNSSNKLDMLMEKGVNWNKYPDFFKKGQYFIKKKVVGEIDSKLLEKIPPQHREKNKFVEKTIIEELIIPPISKVEDPIEIFYANKKN